MRAVLQTVSSVLAIELGGKGTETSSYISPEELRRDTSQKGERLGTLILMSPMLMFRGISGRFMFFTAETARAGAADRPPCPKRNKREKNNFTTSVEVLPPHSICAKNPRTLLKGHSLNILFRSVHVFTKTNVKKKKKKHPVDYV